jgi:hypothetical protein
MRVVSDTDLRVAMLSGAVVLFAAGEEREIADEVATVALQMGARLVGSSAITEESEKTGIYALDNEQEEILDTSVEDAVEEIVTIIETIVSEGNPKNFKTDNAPKAAVINKLAKRKVTTAEREAAWQIYLDR